MGVRIARAVEEEGSSRVAIELTLWIFQWPFAQIS